MDKVTAAVATGLGKQPGDVSASATAPETTEPKSNTLEDAAAAGVLSAMAGTVAAAAAAALLR